MMAPPTRERVALLPHVLALRGPSKDRLLAGAGSETEVGAVAVADTRGGARANAEAGAEADTDTGGAAENLREPPAASDSPPPVVVSCTRMEHCKGFCPESPVECFVTALLPAAAARVATFECTPERLSASLSLSSEKLSAHPIKWKR